MNESREPRTKAPNGWLEIVLRTYRKFQVDRCTVMAAAISYRVLFSIVPATAMVVTIVGWILRKPEIRKDVVDQVTRSIPIDRSLVTDALGTLSATSQPLTVAGAILLVWAGSGIFSTVRESLNTTWGVGARSFVRQKMVDLAAILGLGVLVALSILGNATLDVVKGITAGLLRDATPGPQWIWDWSAALLPFAVTLTAFVFGYRYVPNVRHGFRDVAPGAVLGAILFEGAKWIFGFYVARFDRLAMVYGALGTVMLFLLWVYVSAVILLIGAELNFVWAESRAPKGSRARAR